MVKCKQQDSEEEEREIIADDRSIKLFVHTSNKPIFRNTLFNKKVISFVSFLRFVSSLFLGGFQSFFFLLFLARRLLVGRHF